MGESTHGSGLPTGLRRPPTSCWSTTQHSHTINQSLPHNTLSLHGVVVRVRSHKTAWAAQHRSSARCPTGKVSDPDFCRLLIVGVLPDPQPAGCVAGQLPGGKQSPPHLLSLYSSSLLHRRLASLTCPFPIFPAIPGSGLSGCKTALTLKQHLPAVLCRTPQNAVKIQITTCTSFCSTFELGIGKK